MSRETTQWLNTNVLRGFTSKRGHAWHYSKAAQEGLEPNHYDNEIPVPDLYRRLFGWKAVPRVLYMDNGDAGITQIDGQVAWVRDDTDEVLGIHTDSYSGHQYSQWCVKAVESILGQGLCVANAGLLRNGAVAWVQVEMPDNITTANGVSIRPFLMATTSFDGSIATTYKTGYTDTVCDNTRDMFLREAGDVFRVKHTSKSGLKIAEARDALNIMFRATEEFEAEIAKLCAVDVSDRQWQKFVEAYVPTDDAKTKNAITIAEKKREQLTQLWNTDTRVSPWRGSAWGVIQATDTYGQHLSIVRNANRFERNMLNAIQGKISSANKLALETLEKVMDRPIISV